jgi:hypothetical protein
MEQEGKFRSASKLGHQQLLTGSQRYRLGFEANGNKILLPSPFGGATTFIVLRLFH